MPNREYISDRAAQAGDQAVASPQRRLLLVKFGAIGDVIMAIPAAARMHALGYQVDWIASEQVAPILQLYPWIQVLPVNESMLLRGTIAARTASMVRLWRRLWARVREHGAYDTIATLYYDRRYAALTLPLQARRKLLLSRTDRRFMLLSGRHHTDEYERILTGRPDTVTPGQLAPVPAPGLPATALALSPGRPRIVLVPAGARNVLRDDALRRWPVEQYVSLARQLLSAGCEVILAGGPDDRWASPHFTSLDREAAEGRIQDLIGTLSLVETLSLLDSADVTVVHDTGPLHLAGITRTAIVTVFGPTDPHGRLPQRANAVALWGGANFACRPCYDGRDYAPCSHNGCIAEVTPEIVQRQVHDLLAARDRGQELPPRVLETFAGADLVQLEPTNAGGQR